MTKTIIRTALAGWAFGCFIAPLVHAQGFQVLPGVPVFGPGSLSTMPIADPKGHEVAPPDDTVDIYEWLMKGGI